MLSIGEPSPPWWQQVLVFGSVAVVAVVVMIVTPLVANC